MGFLESAINDLCNISISANLHNSLTQTLATYNSGANNAIVTLMRDSVFAVGASLLTLFMLIDLVTMINRADSSGSGLRSIRLPVNMLLKFAIFASLYCFIPTILSAIQQIAANIAASMSAAASYDIGIGVSSSQITAIADAINDLSFFDRIYTYITVLIAWCVIKVVGGILTVTVLFRMFELWLYILFSPIPLSTFANAELKSTGINFLKGFVALCLQGAAIIGCFLIYQAIMSSGFVRLYDGSVDISEYISTFLFNNIFYAFALAVSVMSSGRLCRQIVNAI